MLSYATAARERRRPATMVRSLAATPARRPAQGSGPGVDFSAVRIFPLPGADAGVRAMEARRRLQMPDSGIGPQSGTGPVTTPGSPPGATLPAAPTYGATPMDTRPPAPTLALSGVGSYADGTESRETITYTVTIPAGAKHKDYCLVQWVKGYARSGSGAYFIADLYGAEKDINFPDWTIDSADPDPIYWSDKLARWNYDTKGQTFTATDSPGPALDSEKGAEYALNFKVAVYETAKVPKTTTGSISTTPVTGFEPWSYSVLVSKAGKFTHPKI
jgi:hypothetical protein